MTPLIETRTAREEFRADWPLLLNAMMGSGLSAILAYTLSVFIDPIGRDFRWNAEIVVTGFTLSTVLGVIGVIFSGKVIKRVGAYLALAADDEFRTQNLLGGLFPRHFYGSLVRRGV